MVERIREIPVAPARLSEFEPILGRARLAEIEESIGGCVGALKGRTVFTVTAEEWGGSVPENRRTLVRYARGQGLDARWWVLGGSPEFFDIARWLRAALQGATDLEPAELPVDARSIYEQTLSENVAELLALCRRGDVMVLHDPATAGMVGPLVGAGMWVVWRCHHSTDAPSAAKDRAWKFLEADLAGAHAWIFPRVSLAPSFCHPDRLHAVPTTIDPFSPKNREQDADTRRAILVHTGLQEPPAGPGRPAFLRSDGSPGRVEHRAEIVRLGRAFLEDTRLVAQLARWDPEKDAAGVIEGFECMLAGAQLPDVDLLIAGPDPASSHEGAQSRRCYEAVRARWRLLPHALRGRVHIALLPLVDPDEHSAIVNAIQSRAEVVVQKSLHEGIGLAVTEAMWKGKPILASGVGGLREQVEDGVSGLLLEDPSDVEAFARLLRGLLEDEDRAQQLGREARQRVAEHHLDAHALEIQARILRELVASGGG
jgi:trehalose synthase